MKPNVENKDGTKPNSDEKFSENAKPVRRGTTAETIANRKDESLFLALRQSAEKARSTDEAAQMAESFEVEIDEMVSAISEAPKPRKIGHVRAFSPEHMRRPLTKKERRQKLFGNLVRHGDFVLLAADSGTGKSAVGCYMGLCAERKGNKFLDHPRLQNEAGNLRTGYADLETDVDLFRSRHSSFWPNMEYRDTHGHNDIVLDPQRDETVEDFSRRFMDAASDQISNANKYLPVIDLAINEGCDVVVLDSITELMTKASTEELIKIIKLLYVIKKSAEARHKKKITLIVLGHIAKHTEVAKSLQSKDSYGGMQLQAKVDVVLRMANARTNNFVYLVQTKSGRDRAGVFTGRDDGEVLHFQRKAVHDEFHGEQYTLLMDEDDKTRFIREKDVMPLAMNAHLTPELAEDKATKIARFIIGEMTADHKMDKITVNVIKSRMRRRKAAAEKRGEEWIYPISNEGTLTKLWDDIKEKLRENHGTAGNDAADLMNEA